MNEENKVVDGEVINEEKVPEKKKFSKKRIGLLIVAGIAAAIGIGGAVAHKKGKASKEDSDPAEPGYDGSDD